MAANRSKANTTMTIEDDVPGYEQHIQVINGTNSPKHMHHYSPVTDIKYT